MLIALILIVLAATGVVLVLLGVVVAGIRQESAWTELNCVPPSPMAVMVRRLCGLHVRRLTPTEAGTDRQEEGSPDTPATWAKAIASREARGG
jgi:hypothetical protein